MPASHSIHRTAVIRKEQTMQNLTPVQYWLDETERNAYNAAFYELGLRLSLIHI